VTTPSISVREGHPDFLDLEWSKPIDDWRDGRTVELPAGIHRHPVRFVSYPEGIYVVKELLRRIAYHEFDTLRSLELQLSRVGNAVAVVDRPWMAGDREGSGVVITAYVDYAFTYRELVSEGGFGRSRDKMLDAFAGLLVELHLAGCYWGDCSLSNVLYRYDAGAIEAVMIDAETAEIHDTLSDGQRLMDIDIMTLNVAGEMADIAASKGLDLDEADMELGEDIAQRYDALWSELKDEIVIGSDERYKIREHISRLNELGFDLDELDLVPTDDGSERVRVKVHVAGRSFHSNRLRELTRIDASENQARQILADLAYYEARLPTVTSTGKSLTAMRWRVDVFEPLLVKIRTDAPSAVDPVQLYCDFLHHRYKLASHLGRDVTNDEAYAKWLTDGMPGY
jgi:Domain of unknown function (DUF4032)